MQQTLPNTHLNKPLSLVQMLLKMCEQKYIYIHQNHHQHLIKELRLSIQYYQRQEPHHSYTLCLMLIQQSLLHILLILVVLLPHLYYTQNKVLDLHNLPMFLLSYFLYILTHVFIHLSLLCNVKTNLLVYNYHLEM